MSNAPQPKTSDPLALSKAELARALGISERHLHTLDRTGRLGPRAIRLNRSVRYSRAEVEAWLAAGAPPRTEWDSQRLGLMMPLNHGRNRQDEV